MGIINIHGYCHARVHASITSTVPSSSFHQVVLVDWFLAILLPFAMLLSFVTLPSFVTLQPFATLQPVVMLQPFVMLQSSGTKST